MPLYIMVEDIDNEAVARDIYDHGIMYHRASNL